MKILVLNAGSSSQKSCLYEIVDSSSLPEHPPQPVWEAKVDWSHHQGFAEMEVVTAQGTCLKEEIRTHSRPAVIAYLLDTLWKGETQVIKQLSDINVVGHRVVHGGQEYRESVRITAEVKAAISRLIPLAPAHNPASLEGIESVTNVLPQVPQVAVFDTAFHSQMPQASALYAGPYEWFEQGIRRYGFHGISHQYCAQRTAQILGRDLNTLKLITCHLGNGCSLAAIQHGHSIDTTMGFTPLDGLMMGSRSGSVDPGILIHLLRQENYTAAQLDQVLNQASGLKGISGISSDMRQVSEAAAKGSQRARLALDMYIHRLQAGIGSMLAGLKGLDVLVFTAGVGENSAWVRASACEAFEFLGLKLDPRKNQQSPADQDIAAVDSSIRVVVVHTQEDWAIAQECWKLMQLS
ncbi:acetate kinase [Leptothermofonsia sp. ETS-13]|uniref:acetate kinase n=1 Tax=Leptothermofonsia sp. ETS-13 TaxID=3035696 RepID=UPI003BA20925